MTTGRSRAVASCAAEFDESSRLRPSVPAMTSVERWEKRAEIPLLLLAVAFLIAYAWPVLNPRLDPNLRTILDVASWTVWVAFLIDFIGRLYFAHERRKYALTHWYDVALITLPMLRPLRLLRLLAFARVLNRSAAGSLVGRISAYVAGTGVVALGLGALAVLDAEQDAPSANITTFGDALWWSATTVTTVGYGDHFPVTTLGRLVAVGLMLVGIACIGAITAGVAAWLVAQVQADSRGEVIDGNNS
jgi:voltage-gated potassium channel